MIGGAYCRTAADMRLRLMKEATINAKQAGERGISAKSVKKVTEVSCTEFSSWALELTRY
jgi:UDP-N-acetylmuramoylalanine-D-glutamate ligase